MKREIFISLILLLSFSLNIYSQDSLNFTENQWKDYFIKNIKTLSAIEGIWSLNCYTDIYKDGNIENSKTYQNYSKYAIKLTSNGYKAYYISGMKQFKGIDIQNTAIDGEFIINLYSFENNKILNVNAALANSVLEYTFELSGKNVYEEKESINAQADFTKHYFNQWIAQDAARYKSKNRYKWIKLFPTPDIITKEDVKITPIPVSGTGFALTTKGDIVTCYHVIEDANDITVKGIDGNFSKYYHAKLLVSDKTNDLAIIEITDSSFTGINEIPYSAKTNVDEAGTEVFLLGYPMRMSMGDDIKLTNGIISAKSGFQGDITNYQISAAVQPGNSGGPLFDKEGNLIGIVSSKLSDAENASYALKSIFLINLIESLPKSIKINERNKLKSKSLSEQVEMVKKLIYIVEAK